MATSFIGNKKAFITEAVDFFSTLFPRILDQVIGEINLRTFKPERQRFFSSKEEAADWAYDMCNAGIDVYFGVNPRVDKGGEKNDVRYLTAFHAEIDYGIDGHKKKPKYLTYEDALKSIRAFRPTPTVIIHSGGGFHCYWVLNTPLKVIEYGISSLEQINRSLVLALGGDPGTHDISRVLRIPGTFNFKLPDNPRPVEMISNSGMKYDYEDFKHLIIHGDIEKGSPKRESDTTTPVLEVRDNPLDSIDVKTLPVSDRTKFLILNGNDGTYISRSEADFAVITALVNKGVSEGEIRAIFLNKRYRIGEKYRSHNAPDTYLKYTIKKAREKSNLTEEEMLDPLFISGALQKGDRGGYHLDVVSLQEYIVRKYKLKILDQERAFFKFNGKCFEQVTAESLNALCQKELKDRRNLFKKSSLDEFIHYAVGDILIDSEKARNDQINYLTLQNGLFKLDEGKLLLHTPDIFTTNLLPYDYDPLSKCDRFIQYLDEIFLGDQEKIHFVQEAVGYAFHKSIPTPVVFFLIGGGSNGKSVFINTLSNLVGKENTSNVSFNSLSDKHYIVQLFQKMINISGETPYTKQGNTDIIKAVTSGDWVTGRDLYKNPMKFRPFAKHYLAMNKVPIITDNSHGMWRRILVIEFPRTFSEEEMDRDLEGKLIGELSGIFNWALEGYRRLRQRNFRLEESQSMKLTKQDYRSEMDSVRAFASECLIKTKDSEDKLKFGNIYEMYVAFCQNDGKKEYEKKNDFRRVLKDLGYKIENSKKDGNQVYIFNAKMMDVKK